MNTTDTLSPAEIRAQEMSDFFLIMGDLAAAKAADDVWAITVGVNELEIVAKHFTTPAIVARAAFEAAQARTLLADCAATVQHGVVLAFARPAFTAPQC